MTATLAATTPLQHNLWSYQIERGLPPVTPTEATGYRVISGTGEPLGRVLGIQHDRHGRPKWLAFLEDETHATPRLVKLHYVRDITNGTVRLAGPREGYHITRVMIDPLE